MSTIPAPTLIRTREEWSDADFDLPDGVPLHTHSDKGDNDEDWDVEMDLGKTGGAKAKVSAAATVLSSSRSDNTSTLITIRPPLPQGDNNDDEDDKGLSTIKASAFPKDIFNPVSLTPLVDEDIEAAFALPSDLSCLSLAPLSLNHRSSKGSLEWGDKEHTSSSQSSDAYSSLGFADASSSSNSVSSISLPNSASDKDGDDDDDNDSELDGLVLPSALFESSHGGRQLTKILETKKKAQITDDRVKVPTPDPEDDFETGLVIDDDVNFSPSRLLTAQQQSHNGPIKLHHSLPPRPTFGPSFRLRAKSPNYPPPSSSRQLGKLRLSPSPPLRSISRSQTFQPLPPAPLSSPPVSFLSSKPGGLRCQKSHSGLKPAAPPTTQRKLNRKASLSSLMETGYSKASGSASESPNKFARYDAPTTASRARSHKNSLTSRLEFIVPPTRPSTPSSNPAALRLTMPASSRLKSRPTISSVFSSVSATSNTSRSVSPLPPRPPSIASTRARIKVPMNPPPSAPKVLRRPKRQRTYGDGTELDAIDDLPTDREKEGRFRVQPKAHGNRIPGGSYSSKTADQFVDKGTLRRKGILDVAELTASTSRRRSTERVEVPSKGLGEILQKKRRNASSLGHVQSRKPTLIRNLGGAGAPKMVGEMKWNPQTLRWEGNDHVLRDFDAATGTSIRPALITHLTGSSIGSPVGSFASGARLVGNMIFDPSRMCWISTLPAEEDEPDVFANLADDEEDADGWEIKDGTIRASLQQLSLSSCDTTMSSTLLHTNHARTLSDSGSDRGSRASIVYDVDDAFLENCQLAEARHYLEMKSWCMTTDPAVPPDHLYEIRALATRNY